MMKVALSIAKKDPIKILCLGAHGDDIEIGCGGALLKLTEEHDNTEIHWVAFSALGLRKEESRLSAQAFLNKAKKKNVILLDFRDGYFPYNGSEIKEYFEKLKKLISPDIIFTHYRHDLHQDHRLISELTWNTFRDHLIIEYEIMKYDGDLGVPNLFVELSPSLCRKKIDIITKAFKSQADKSWFTPDAFYSIMRIRGIEAKALHRSAEAFYCRKIVL